MTVKNVPLPGFLFRLTEPGHKKREKKRREKKLISDITSAGRSGEGEGQAINNIIGES